MSTMQLMLKRGGLLVAVLAAMLALAAPAAGSPQGFGATEWLAEQLKTPEPPQEGKYCELGGPSVGQTIDCMLAFDAAARSLEAKREATYEWIRANMDKYVGEKSCEEGPASLSAGAVAKLALAVLSRGDDPREVGGRNLIEDLECLQVEAGGEAGRFKDIGASDFSNVFGQSLALVSLKACEVNCPGEPKFEVPLEKGASYLRGQQCAESEPEALDGAFRSSLGLVASECDENPPFAPENPNAVDVDSTGAAVQGLFAEGSGASEAAGESALNWLSGRQQPPGPPPVSFWENYCDFAKPMEPFPSVNSTALAIMAYTEKGFPIMSPQAWLSEVVEENPAHGMPACTASGPPDVFATAQGILGLFGTSYPELAGLP